MTALTGFTGAIALIGAAVYYAAPAPASEYTVNQWVNAHGTAVCAALDVTPTIAGVQRVGDIVQSDTWADFTAFEAGEVLGSSTTKYCPHHVPLLLNYADTHGNPEWKPNQPWPSEMPRQLAGAAERGRVYANCTEARRAGDTDIPISDGAYWPGGDRDGDGVACES